MQLPIEKWASEKQLPDEAAETLREAAVCHRAGAYRAALLFTYVTWGLVLRSRILRATCPASCLPGKWGAVQAAMSNEDKWDAEVFDATQMQGQVMIFTITDDLRTQIRYWKDRRNDCAHSKRNDALAAVLLAAPHHCTILDGSPEATRKLWRTTLPTGGSAATALYAALLRNGLIPAAEVSEAHVHLIDTVLTPPPATDMDFDALVKNGFFDAFRRRAFIDLKLNSFEWGNSHADMIAYYLAQFQLDDEVAKAIATVFASRYHPHAARDRISALLRGTPTKQAELVEAISRLSLSWPDAVLGPGPAVP